MPFFRYAKCPLCQAMGIKANHLKMQGLSPEPEITVPFELICDLIFK
ncbi:MAG: hypothetical protein H6Q07_1255 [Acidobacteria bacterium]|nr:hypothetical protein [Acidobacteriota bacterium]